MYHADFVGKHANGWLVRSSLSSLLNVKQGVFLVGAQLSRDRHCFFWVQHPDDEMNFSPSSMSWEMATTLGAIACA